MMSHETPPMTFPFVLTNSNGLKMHGVVLHVAEEIDSHKVGGMVSRALSNSRGYMSGGREGAAAGPHSPKAGSLLSPARIPTWLRDTVRWSSFMKDGGGCYVQSQVWELDQQLVPWICPTGEIESNQTQIGIEIGSMCGILIASCGIDNLVH